MTNKRGFYTIELVLRYALCNCALHTVTLITINTKTMNYRKRPPRRRRTHEYFIPFFVLILLIAVVIFGWRGFNKVFIDGKRSTINEKVFLNIEEGGAKAMTVGRSEWQNVPNNINLYRGERLKTSIDGRAALTFFDKSLMRMNTGTEVYFTLLKKKKETNNIEVELINGQIWTKIDRMNNPDSNFTITTDLLTIDIRDSVLAINAPGTVYMIKGSAQIGVKYDDDIIKTYTLGVGQQFMVNEKVISDLRDNQKPEVIFALSDTFKTSDWYQWNTKKDGTVVAFEESEIDERSSVNEGEEAIIHDNIGRLVYVTRPSKNSATNKSSINLEGYFDSTKIKSVYIQGEKANVISKNKWQVKNLSLKKGVNNITIEADDLGGSRSTLTPFKITYDKTSPLTPEIREPGNNDDTVAIEDIEQQISGAVSADTYAVIINDYRLSKYVPGSKEFHYYAKTVYGNLEVGENEYLVYAEDKAGNRSEPAKIILTLSEEVIESAKVKTEEEVDEDVDEEEETDESEDLEASDETATPATSSAGGVKIIAPNNGENLQTSETHFEIKGVVPTNTAKVVVNDYTLQAYEAGDTSWTYRASSTFKNLKIGKKNTYTAKAYDKDDELIGSASITIDVESGASAAPKITMPTNTGSYSTTLDEIVIGGTVGKWAQKIYVNDLKLPNYIPGSTKWRYTAKLKSGKNTFRVYAEKGGESSETDTIVIDYTQ